MPRDRRTLLVVEGDDDRALLAGVITAGLLHGSLDVALPPPPTRGIAGIAGAMVAYAKAGIRAMVVIDFDRGGSVHELRGHLEGRGAALSGEEARDGRVLLARVQLGALSAPIPIVLAGDRGHAAWGFEAFAMDDLAIKLSAHPRVLGHLCKTVGFPMAWKKLTEVCELFDANGIPVRDTKRLLHLLRAIIGYRASPAEYIRELVARAAAAEPQALRAACAPLLDDIEFALATLGA